MDPSATKPLRLLSLDGGGVKGLTSLLILQEIFRALEKEVGHEVQPYECFDLIGGTSTGGLIAIMLGRLLMTISEAIDAYKSLSPQIFQKKWWTQSKPLKFLGGEAQQYWFDGKNLENAVKKLLKERNVSEEVRLFDPDSTSCKTFVCAVSALSTQAELLRSYKAQRTGHRDYDCSVCEAVRATSAAPLFFEPVTLKGSNATFIDGGVRVNNPIEQIKNEAENIWPSRPIGCIVSIGTGVTVPQGFNPKKSRLHAVLQSLASIATDANNKAREFRDSKEGKSLFRGKKYFRYSVPQGMGEVDMADFEKVPYMEAITLPYMMDVDYSIEECAQSLANPSELPGETKPIQRISTLPPYTNVQFVGRGEYLQKIDDIFAASHSSQQRVVIWGLSGVGKSQIALRYGEINNAQQHVFWVSAATRETFQSDFTNIWRALSNDPLPGNDLENMLKIVKEVLEKSDIGPWLLILDGADDKDLFVKKADKSPAMKTILPRAAHGRILITSTDSRIRGLADGQVTPINNGFEVLPMSIVEGVTLLRAYIPMSNQVGVTDADCEELVRKLETFPLALVQAAAYIREEQITVNEYLTVYGLAQDDSVMFEDHPATSWNEGEQSILTTWEMSYKRIGGCDEADAKSPSAKLLDRLGFLAMSFPTAKYIVKGLYEMYITKEPSFHRAVSPLINFGLVNQNSEDKEYWIHPLVHKWISRRLYKRPEHQACVESVINLIGVLFPSDRGDQEYETLGQRLLPHGLRVLDVALPFNLRFTAEAAATIIPSRDDTYAKKAPFRYGMLLRNVSNFLAYLNMEYYSISILEQHLEKTTLTDHTSHMLLGELHYWSGTFRQAGPVFERLIQPGKANDNYWPRRRLDICLLRDDRGEETISYHRQEIQNTIEIFGEDSMETISAQNNLADCLVLNAFGFWDTPTIGGEGAREYVTNLLNNRFSRVVNGESRLEDEASLTEKCLEQMKTVGTERADWLECLARQFERKLSPWTRSDICKRLVWARMDIWTRHPVFAQVSVHLEALTKPGTSAGAQEFGEAFLQAFPNPASDDDIEELTYHTRIVGLLSGAYFWDGKMVRAAELFGLSLKREEQLVEKSRAANWKKEQKGTRNFLLYQLLSYVALAQDRELEHLFNKYEDVLPSLEPLPFVEGASAIYRSVQRASQSIRNYALKRQQYGDKVVLWELKKQDEEESHFSSNDEDTRDETPVIDWMIKTTLEGEDDAESALPAGDLAGGPTTEASSSQTMPDVVSQLQLLDIEDGHPSGSADVADTNDVIKTEDVAGPNM
ncbi:hypothetical protein ACLOAV_010851 [Pseudogymnoascus australis]